VKQRLQLLLDAKMTLDEALQLRNVTFFTARAISLTISAGSHQRRSCGSHLRPLTQPSCCSRALHWGLSIAAITEAGASAVTDVVFNLLHCAVHRVKVALLARCGS
jgi:hypothetical protein